MPTPRFYGVGICCCREADSSAALRNDKQNARDKYGDSGCARMTTCVREIYGGGRWDWVGRDILVADYANEGRIASL